MKNPSIMDFPDEILLEIFSYINIHHLKNTVYDVCKRWRNLTDSDVLWTDYSFDINQIFLGDLNSLLVKMPRLRHFKYFVAGGETDYIIVSVIEHCRFLRTFQMPLANIRPELLETLMESLKYLKCLQLLINPNSKRLTEIVGRSETLTTLMLVQTEYSVDVLPDFLKPIADGSPNLTYLHFQGLYHIEEDMNYLLMKKKHQLIGFHWCGAMYTSTLICLSECSMLNNITFKMFMLADELVSLRTQIHELNFKNLRTIAYYGSPIDYLNVILKGSYSVLKILKLFKPIGDLNYELGLLLASAVNLEELYLEGMNLNDEVIRQIRSSKLKAFHNIRNSGIESSSYKFLRENCKEVEKVVIVRSRLTPDSYEEIFQFKSLKKLFIRTAYWDIFLTSTIENSPC